MRSHQDVYDTANTLTRGKFERFLVEQRALGATYDELAQAVNKRWKLDVASVTVRSWFVSKHLPGGPESPTGD